MSAGLIPNDGGAEPYLITPKELAIRLNVSKRTLWRLRSDGRVPPPLRLGGVVRWRLDEVQNWIAAGCPAIKSRENNPRRT
jgi:prophage regulatory protein